MPKHIFKIYKYVKKFNIIRFLISLIVLCQLIFVSCGKNDKYYLEKNLSALGGINALNNIRSKKMTGKFIIHQKFEIPFTIFLKKPNLIRVESMDKSNKYISAFDGHKFWWINSLANIDIPTEMPEQDAARLIDMQLFYWGYLQQVKEKKYHIKFIGKELIDSQEFYVLEIIKKGNESHLYLDAESYLEQRIVGKLQDYNIKAETVFSSYKKIQDTIFPHKIEFILNGNTDVTTIIDSIELNIDIDETLFSMPKPIEMK